MLAAQLSGGGAEPHHEMTERTQAVSATPEAAPGEGPSFHIVTFGCQMNKLDSELAAAELVARGYRSVDDPGRADVVLYYTCSVREHAENRVLSHLGSWRRRAEDDPRFVLGVLGCMAQRLGGELVRKFPYVKLVCGSRAFLRVPGHLEAIRAGEGPIVDVGMDAFTQCRRPALRPRRHSAYVSIMRGCDNYCAYCIVPYVRGREVSRPVEEVAGEVERLCEDGAAEITLLGQNVDSYGKGLTPPSRLSDLLRRVAGTPGLRRLRFVTNHPRDVGDDLLRAVADLEPVCEHLHVPAQSGSSAVLARMRRGYTRERYLEIVESARRVVPGVEIASDFLVGFPGETDEDFEQTLSLMEEVRFQQSFIFKYSPRPGTLAARWPDDVPEAVKRERNQRLLEAQQRIDTERRGALVGTVAEVMVEGANPADREGRRLSGRTRGNDIVFFSQPALGAESSAEENARAAEDMAGSVLSVRITGSTALTLFGEFGG